MKQSFKTLFLFSLLFSSSLFADNKFLFTGSSTVAPLVAELARSFEKQHSNYKIEVQTGGSAKGINDCQNQLNDYGMISRELKKEEKAIIEKEILYTLLSVCTTKIPK